MSEILNKMSENEIIIERLTSYFNSSIAGVEKTLNLSNGTLRRFYKGISNTPYALIKALKYENLNPDYFLKGIGTPTGEAEVQEENQPVPLSEEKESGRIPYYDIDVMAHISEGLDLKEEVPSAWMNIPGFKDCVACFPVFGDSMEPKISNGDIIAVSEAVALDHILWGEIYLVITDAWRVVKTVHPGKTEEYIILRSINPAFAGDTNVHKDELRALYMVKGVISRFSV